MSDRELKLSQTIQKLSAEFLERNSNRTSLITVTSVVLKTRAREATIYVTVLPDTQEKAAIDFANRQVKDLRDYISKNSRIGMIPRLTFAIDLGEKNRQRIDFLSQND